MQLRERLGRSGLGAEGLAPLMGKDQYTYSFNWPLADFGPTVSLPKFVNIENDAEFLWTKATLSARINNTDSLTYDTRVLPYVSFQWRDTSSSQQIFNIPIPVTNFWGTGEIPFILPEPKLLLPKTSVTIDATNLHANDSYDLTLSMIGIKLFRA